MGRASPLGSCLSICLVTGCAASGAGRYYGVPTTGRGIVFVLDVSSSMQGRSERRVEDAAAARTIDAGKRAADTAVRNSLPSKVGGLGDAVTSWMADRAHDETYKLGRAKRELAAAIETLPDSATFMVITFCDRVTRLNRDLIPATRSARQDVARQVRALDTCGETRALAALIEATAVPGASVAFFVSDGVPSDAPPARIPSEVRDVARRRGIVIHTVGLGDDQDRPFLQSLAEQNGGRYVPR